MGDVLSGRLLGETNFSGFFTRISGVEIMLLLLAALLTLLNREGRPPLMRFELLGEGEIDDESLKERSNIEIQLLASV